MSQQNLIEAAGGHAQKETHFVPLFTSRFLAGYYTNRSLLRSPLQSLYSDFYHIGATDTLCDGLNSELSVRQTIIRRPGNPLYCTAETAAAIDDFYFLQRYDGTIQVIADSVADGRWSRLLRSLPSSPNQPVRVKVILRALSTRFISSMG